MGRSEGYIIPSRVLCTVGHFLAIVVAYAHAETNVRASLSSDASGAEIEQGIAEFIGIWGVALGCIIAEIVSLMLMVTAFFPKFSALQIALHFCGSLYTSSFVLYKWHFYVFWYNTVIFNVLPACLELAMVVMVLHFKVVRY